jgi:hypothetical protein
MLSVSLILVIFYPDRLVFLRKSRYLGGVFLDQTRFNMATAATSEMAVTIKLTPIKGAISGGTKPCSASNNQNPPSRKAIEDAYNIINTIRRPGSSRPALMAVACTGLA